MRAARRPVRPSPTCAWPMTGCSARPWAADKGSLDAGGVSILFTGKRSRCSWRMNEVSRSRSSFRRGRDHIPPRESSQGYESGLICFRETQVFGRFAGADKALDEIGLPAPGRHALVVDADLAPIVLRAHIDDRIAEVNRPVIEPVGMIDPDFTRRDDLADHGQMRPVRARIAGQDEDGTLSGIVAAGEF